MKRRYAPKVDATPEEMAKALFSLPANYEWQYEKGEGRIYTCDGVQEGSQLSRHPLPRRALSGLPRR